MSRIADYSFARPSLDQLVSLGYSGVARYLCRLPNSKAIDVAESQAIFARGLSLTLVWEQGTSWSTWNGREADRQADVLGFPDYLPIYWAVDQDVPDSQYSQVSDALNALPSKRPRGIYAGSGLCQYCLNNNSASFAWITSASSWGHGEPAPGAHLRQRIGAPISGIDENDILRPFFGQWNPSAPTPPPPRKVDTLLFVVKGDASNEWWLTDYVYKRWITSQDEFTAIVLDVRGNGGLIAYHDTPGEPSGPLLRPQAVIDRIPRNDVPAGASPGTVVAPTHFKLSGDAVAVP